MLGTYALSAGYYDAYYGKAQKVRTLIIRDFAAAYERFDVLLSPTAPTEAFAIGEKASDPLAMYLSDVCTIPTNLAGHAAMSVPFGVRRRRPARSGSRCSRRRSGEPVMFRAAACPRGRGAVTTTSEVVRPVKRSEPERSGGEQARERPEPDALDRIERTDRFTGRSA